MLLLYMYTSNIYSISYMYIDIHYKEMAKQGKTGVVNLGGKNRGVQRSKSFRLDIKLIVRLDKKEV